MALFALVLSLSLAAADRPNVVLFVADDMGCGDVQAYDPSSTIPTPNMNRLAREGLRFTDAHSAAAVCTPSRYALLTGRYPFRSRPYRGVLRSAYDQPLLEAGQKSVAGLLRQAGYRTAAFGKWHLGMSFPNKAGDGIARPGVGTSQFTTTDVDFTKPILDGPLDHGFDTFFGIGSSINHGPYTFIKDRRVVERPTRIRSETTTPGGRFREGWIAPGWDDTQQGVATCQDASDFIARHVAQQRETPFFIYYAATANHWPHCPPASLGSHPIKGQGGNDDHKPLRNDMVVQNDVILGELMARLDDPNGDGNLSDSVLDDTLLLVTSDNGADAGSYQPFRDRKGSIYEGGHRVPFLARWPGHIPDGTTSNQLICGVDLYATFAALAGTPPEADSDGASILPALLGQSIERGKPLLIQKAGSSKTFAVRDGDWKLIVNNGDPAELFDLGKDLRETTNLLDDHPDVVARLTKAFRQQTAERP